MLKSFSSGVGGAAAVRRGLHTRSAARRKGVAAALGKSHLSTQGFREAAMAIRMGDSDV
jgi:hypothetical protein